jgi:serine/threonine-protein phosphatase PP1 catalytic subunit
VEDNYKPVEEPIPRSFSDRFKRVRRRPGSDQLGAQADGTFTPLPQRRKGHKRSQTWSNSSLTPSGDCAQSLLQSIQQIDMENAQRRKRGLEEQQALWEATVPKSLTQFIERHSDERS